ncbi:MAG: GTP-binding protein LepA [Microgenomates group bacterium Gr01-1014_7]|nr:MAG: GTP-binding protein LepA [Microgenomates group bacterium Gr01-1014_7]
MYIRNFSIIAHVDHGKSTLADRFLEITGTVPKDKLQPQILDSLALERERGITIKLAPVRLNYTLNAIPYTLNLIDTPGHVDFSYEVSRALNAVEGAILLVDATQGIQAQTLSHGLSALEQNLVLIPVINKIDLPNANIEKTKKELVDSFGFKESEVLLVSAKTGEGVEEILKAVIERIQPPKVDPAPSGAGLRALRALVFDSFFDSYKGVVAQIRVIDGEVGKIGSEIKFLGTKAEGQVLEVGYFSPHLTPADRLGAGEIGYIATGIKQPDLVRVGDTISTDSGAQPLPGYKQVKPMVYVGFYPLNQDEYYDIKDALDRFRLNDPAFTFEPEHSTALGTGFRCGFLGLLHAEVVQERLSQEFEANLIATTPSVEYLVDGKEMTNPSELDPSHTVIEEPWVSLKIFVPQTYIGSVMELVQDKRGVFKNMQHFGIQVELTYEMPLSEMITDFYDKLKSVSSGFASLDWEFLDFREVDGVRVDILVGGEKVDALSTIVVRQKAEYIGRRMVEKLKEVLPRQNFEVALQAAIGGKIIARETLSSFRKDVTAKLYGGDRTRKDKLLEKQKKGKKKMKMIGKVEIPQEAFLSILKS